MYELDKEKFGQFVAELRKEKGYTQKELAERLYLSDKAISKWERGLSMPDISVLVPLADILEVTVTELLEGRRISKTDSMDARQVETLVQKAIRLSEEDLRQRGIADRNWVGILALCFLIACVELLVINHIGYTWEQMEADYLFAAELLSVLIGAYFCIGVKKYLPTYYDENKVSVYSDGFLRMNMTGVYFNNRNWPHIVRALRISTMTVLVGYPLLCVLFTIFLPGYWPMIKKAVFLIVILGSLLVPLYVAARKYK